VYWRTGALIASGETPEPRLVWPPLQSWLLAGTFRLFGEAREPILVLQTALFFASAVLLRRLVLRAGRTALAADVAFALFLLDPQIASMARSSGRRSRTSSSCSSRSNYYAQPVRPGCMICVRGSRASRSGWRSS
jgi:hypothetical protein